MYFRLKKTKSTPVLQLVESFRNGEGQPRQRILISLGNVTIQSDLWHDLASEIENRLNHTPVLFQAQPEVLQWADFIMAELEKSGKISSLSKVSSQEQITVQTDKISHHDTTEVGPSLVVKQAWDQLGLAQILEELGFSKTEIRDTAISVFNRLIDPCSEHALPAWVKTVALPELFGDRFGLLGDDRFYRISDKIIDHQEPIEKALAEQETHLFNLKPMVYLYDLSNTYFEGSCLGNSLAKRGGHSKEKRNDAPQIAFGMVVDPQGFIVKHKVFPGNTSDSPTLLEMVRSLNPHEDNPLVVMDSGMASKENLLQLKEIGWDYITVGKRPSRIAYDYEFEDISDFRKIQGRQGKDPVYVKFLDTEDERLVCCYSEERATKEDQILSKAESRFIKDLEKLKERIRLGRLKKPDKINQSLGRLKERHSRVSRYYEQNYDQEEKCLTWNRLDQKYEQARQVTGGYLLRTNRKTLEEQTIWKIYITLTRVESSFRVLKSDLGLRPIFHQTAKRCKAHIFITILAYHLLHWIEYSLRAQNESRSWPTIRRLLQTHAYTTLVLPTIEGPTYHIRKAGDPDMHQQKIYEMLNIPFRCLPVIKSVI